jgi:hypothetical protein
MKNGKTNHFWRIHQRVMRRMWQDLSTYTQDIIANDVDHTTEEFKWFEAKALADATRLYEDEAYHDNNIWTFKAPQRES